MNGVASFEEQETFLSERQNLQDCLERETRRALRGESADRRSLFEPGVGMDRIRRRHSDASIRITAGKPKNIRRISFEEQTIKKITPKIASRLKN